MKIKRQSNKKSPSGKVRPLSQLEKVNQALKDLSKDVTPTDRKEAPASEPTVVKYLKGNGEDLETGFKLLKFFRERIEMRDKEINGVI